LKIQELKSYHMADERQPIIEKTVEIGTLMDEIEIRK
jgi:hypothetical protein